MVPVIAAASFFLELPRGETAKIATWPSFDLPLVRRAFPMMGTTLEDDPARQAQARIAIARAAAKYPPLALACRLSRVFVVRKLTYEGVLWGATNNVESRGLIFETLLPQVDIAWTEHAFHHELAHLLQDTRGSDFPRKAWLRANAPGFRYGSGGADAVAKGKVNEAFDAALNAKGLLSEYGASDPDEDWASIAEEVMSNDSPFWGLVAKYPRLKEKARLAIAFYRRVMPGIQLRNVD